MLHALSAEASRMKVLVEGRLNNPIAYPIGQPTERLAIARAYEIPLTVEIRHNPDLDALVSKETGMNAREMVARIDQYNSQLVLKTAVGGFNTGQFDPILFELGDAATALQKSVAIDLAQPGT